MVCRKKFLSLLFLVLIFNIFVSSSVLANEPTIYSQGAILIDAKTGAVLYEKNSNAQMYPASTTKVLTAIIALENCQLDEKVTASYDAIAPITSGYTNAKIQVGEELSMEDLLYALLLKSANEAANVIAEHIGGSIENFANIMNAKALEIGCTSTHFVNANGIHDSNHYTTASDLAKITQYCMQNQTFRHIVATQQYTLPATQVYPSTDRVLVNSNSLTIPGHRYYYPYAIGVKTGFTTPAKNCLISASSKDGLELISVILHAESTEDGRSARYLDSINLLEYGNNNYKSHHVIKKGEIVQTTEIANASEETKLLNIIAKDDIFVTLKKHETLENISPEISITTDLSAPITENTTIGTATYTINGAIYKTDLIAGSNVELFASPEAPKSSTINFLPLVYILLILIIIRLLIAFLNKYVVIYRVKKLKKRTKKYLKP